MVSVRKVPRRWKYTAADSTPGSLRLNWAARALPADIKEPSLARVANGWAIEQPPHTYFNWHMNRTDNRLVSLEAHLAWLEQQVTRLAQENARLKQLAAER